ncbi:hypothetical protein WN944_026665 [Citrus x changshan-huyou]|uniref:DNA-directed RNA polymerase RpoA/D/Rpb3-type domain-containing protein n=1 Tax=Citrus x changshan-huyou TaxID=2935761 RepID=A0AAP0LSX7_9ROSI
MNLKDIVLRSNLYGTCDALICVKGPGYVTAQDILLPPSVEIVDNTQHIASLTEPIDLSIGLQIERSRGYNIKTPNTFQDGNCYPIDAVFMPVRNANHSIQSYGNGNEKQEILFLEIWTNGSLTPKEALHEASRSLIDLFIPFLQAEDENLPLENNQYKVLKPLKEHPTAYWVLYEVFEIRERNTIRVRFPKELQMDPRVHQSLMVLEPLSLRYMQ